MSNNKARKFFSGKGYYIALILCAVAIGITGYLYYRNADPDDTLLSGEHIDADGTQPERIEAVATGPEQIATDPSATEGTKPAKLLTASPVEGQVVAVYAMDMLDYNQTTRDWRTHNGIDISAEAGTKVKAAAAGQVYTVYEDATMGTTVVICHEGGYVTRYASLDPEVAVSAGDEVSCGDVIGCVGSSALLESAIGDHVHFSVICNDVPMDPQQFLDLQ